MKDGSETGVDCGGGACPPCAAGAGCSGGSDCQSGVCMGGVCATPTCTDGVKNGSETGVDCGGGACPRCAAGAGCSAGSDCQSGVCTGNVCQAPTCTDGVQNGNESDVDCGGSCPPCAIGKKCLQQSDCGTTEVCNGATLRCDACGGSGQWCCFNKPTDWCGANLGCTNVGRFCTCGTYSPSSGSSVLIQAGTQYDRLVSCDGRFQLVMQTDGNLVLYGNGLGALWSSGTSGSAADAAYMQGFDGNFVLYEPGGYPVWASNTAGHPGATLAVQNDGNVVIYAGGPIWATNTCCH